MYAKYDAKKLLPYLRSSANYNVVEALTLCKEKGLTEESVFLLDKLGDRRAALALQLRSSDSIRAACMYVIERDPGSQELWDIVVDSCRESKAKFVELFEYLEYLMNPVHEIFSIGE